MRINALIATAELRALFSKTFHRPQSRADEDYRAPLRLLTVTHYHHGSQEPCSSTPGD
jgi:hypothetical protein